jgi:fructose-1,6-bisphosphatase II
MGLGQPEGADLAAAQAMSEVLSSMAVRGDIVVGEEWKFTHETVLHSHQLVGSDSEILVDLVVDPIDGSTQLANGFPGVISVAAVAPQQSIWRAAGAHYMEKIIVGPDVAPYLVPETLDAPAAWTLALVARIKKVSVRDLTVFLLDRPRHKHIIDEIRAAGAHVLLRPDGDTAGALMVCTPRSGVDLLLGTGGIIQGLLAACAMKSLGGAMFARLDPQSDEEASLLQAADIDKDIILSTDDLVISNQVFFAATGITDGQLLKGVVYSGVRAETDSLILRSETKTRRRIITEHLLDVG